MSVRSRAPWRPTLLEACSSFSTSAGVRYSRVRRSRLDCLRGGIEGEGAARDRGSGAFLLRPLERTFPFWSIGAALAAAGFFGALAMKANHTPPLSATYGKVQEVFPADGRCLPITSLSTPQIHLLSSSARQFSICNVCRRDA
jgi:hypothetical protein